MIDVPDGGHREHMPTYQYRCAACGDELEAIQKFTDPSLSECPSCDGDLRKVFGAVGVVFKGSGFYATDSRKAPSASKPSSGRKPTPSPAGTSPSDASKPSSSAPVKASA